MSLRLTLIRHAKSSWGGGEDDHARALNERGRRACEALGRWLAGEMPEEVLCSDAARARETWQRISETSGGPAATFEPRLYHAEAATILAVLRAARAQHVGLVGHNPGLADFARRVAAAPPNHPRFVDYPTGASTVMTFDTTKWQDVGWQSGEVVDFVVPREL